MRMAGRWHRRATTAIALRGKTCADESIVTPRERAFHTLRHAVFTPRSHTRAEARPGGRRRMLCGHELLRRCMRRHRLVHRARDEDGVEFKVHHGLAFSSRAKMRVVNIHFLSHVPRIAKVAQLCKHLIKKAVFPKSKKMFPQYKSDTVINTHTHSWTLASHQPLAGVRNPQ